MTKAVREKGEEEREKGREGNLSTLYCVHTGKSGQNIMLGASKNVVMYYYIQIVGCLRFSQAGELEVIEEEYRRKGRISIVL